MIKILKEHELDKPIYLQTNDNMIVHYTQHVHDAKTGKLLYSNTIPIDTGLAEIPKFIDKIIIFNINDELDIKNGFGAIYGEKK